ncbi:hypothetical protein HRbin30_00659 [bacterium HR30]|nr:hypothetical protein HRbin30_00659 [bacterium HR30]
MHAALFAAGSVRQNACNRVKHVATSGLRAVSRSCSLLRYVRVRALDQLQTTTCATFSS